MQNIIEVLEIVQSWALKPIAKSFVAAALQAARDAQQANERGDKGRYAYSMFTCLEKTRKAVRYCADGGIVANNVIVYPKDLLQEVAEQFEQLLTRVSQQTDNEN